MILPRPASAVLGADREVATLFALPAEIEAMLRFEAALAEAEAEAGWIDPEAAIRIAAACHGFRPDEAALEAGLLRDGVAVPDLMRQLRAALDPLDRPLLHRGATSQDATDTALMLRLKLVLAILRERLRTLRLVIDRLDAEQGTKAQMAHTRMQAALPFTLADKLRTWSAPLDAHAARLDAAEAGLAIQLGGPIGTDAVFEGRGPTIRAGLARRLGLRDAAPWHTDRSRILDIAHALALLTGTLGKLGADVALMAQTETGHVRLAGSGGSSVMAHKQNPVRAEILVALARLVAGHVGTLGQAMVHEGERSGAAWTLEWFLLPTICEATGAALDHARHLLDGAVFADTGQA